MLVFLQESAKPAELLKGVVPGKDGKVLAVAVVVGVKGFVVNGVVATPNCPCVLDCAEESAALVAAVLKLLNVCGKLFGNNGLKPPARCCCWRWLNWFSAYWWLFARPCMEKRLLGSQTNLYT